MPLLTELAAELAELAGNARLRHCPPLSGTATRATLHGRTLHNFCSNDYLGLSQHPALSSAAHAALDAAGFGATASRLVAGDRPEHRALESTLADWLRTPAALTFPTGYHTNLGVLGALVGAGDLVASDAANHASLIDGCRLARARIAVYPHGDPQAARAALAQPGRFRRRFLLTESLFSMDGDFAPLPELAAAARDHDASLIVDEAHALGALGPHGRGLCALHGVVPDVLIGTFGKALGGFGGFVAGAEVLVRYLVNRARTFLFTTAQPPVVAAGNLAAVRLVASEEGDRLRLALQARVQTLRAGLGDLPESLPESSRPPCRLPLSPIVPKLLGADRAALAASQALLDAGFFVQAIRPPTVPEGTARLRTTVTSQHDPAVVAKLAARLRAL